MNRREIPVADAFGRERQLGVGISSDGRDILFVPPPGEAFLLAPAALPDLIDELLRLQTAAISTRTGRRRP